MGTKLLLCPGNGGSGRAMRGGRCPPRWARGHQGSGFHPNWETTEEWGAQPCSPHPSPRHRHSHPPATTSLNPISISPRGNLGECNRTPAHPPQAPGWSPAPIWRVQTLSPPNPRYLLAARRGPAALRFPWPGSKSEGTVPAHVLSIPVGSTATLWGAERSPPHAGARSPLPPLTLARRLPWFPAS